MLTHAIQGQDDSMVFRAYLHALPGKGGMWMCPQCRKSPLSISVGGVNHLPLC
jgi:hypothetical protein